MAFFTTLREKKFWLLAFTVFIAIFLTLFVGQPLIKVFTNQNFRAAIFVFVMILVGSAIIIHGLKTKPSRLELVALLGITAVYTMFILRLGMPERSHLMEYSVMAIFIHKALIERAKQAKLIALPSLLAFTVTFLVGVLDEFIQLFLPDRVFDIDDIWFNGMAVAMAIGANVILTWVRKLRDNA